MSYKCFTYCCFCLNGALTCPEVLLTLAVATTPRIVTTLPLVTPSLTEKLTPAADSWGSDPGGKRARLLNLSKSSSWT